MARHSSPGASAPQSTTLPARCRTGGPPQRRPAQSRRRSHPHQLPPPQPRTPPTTNLSPRIIVSPEGAKPAKAQGNAPPPTTEPQRGAPNSIPHIPLVVLNLVPLRRSVASWLSSHGGRRSCRNPSRLAPLIRSPRPPAHSRSGEPARPGSGRTSLQNCNTASAECRRSNAKILHSGGSACGSPPRPESIKWCCARRRDPLCSPGQGPRRRRCRWQRTSDD